MNFTRSNAEGLKMKRIALCVATSLALFVTPSGEATAGAATKSPIGIVVKLDRTRIDAGPVIHGVALVTNSSSHSVLIEACRADGWLWVGLGNSRVSFVASSPAVACAPSIRLEPGVDRFPVAVQTTYQECGKTTPPICPASGMPVLPKGDYRVVVVTAGLPKGTRTSALQHVTLS